MSNKLTTGVRKLDDGVAVIDISGDLNGSSEQELMAAYKEASNSHTRSIILNFSGLDYMNSSGIGLLVTLLIRVKRQRQQLLAYGLNAHYQQIFDLTRLNESIGIYNDEQAALANSKHLAVSSGQ
ncbi:MAG: STAS domain-containing protein [Candidatus Promineifilaceae bacterium]